MTGNQADVLAVLLPDDEREAPAWMHGAQLRFDARLSKPGRTLTVLERDHKWIESRGRGTPVIDEWQTDRDWRITEAGRAALAEHVARQRRARDRWHRHGGGS